MSSVSMQSGVLGRQAIFSRRLEERRSVLRWNLAAGMFMFFVLAAQLWVRLLVTQQSYALERVREEALANDVKLRRMNLELAYVSRPMQTTRAAEERLGMTPLTPQRMRKLVFHDSRS